MPAQDPSHESDLRQALRLHLEKQPADAPIHGAIMALEEKIAEFDEADQQAIQVQATYRSQGRLALVSMLMATVFGALVLLPVADAYGGVPRRVIEALQGLALTFSVLLTVWLTLRQSVGRWMSARASAERVRADVFDAIMRAGVADKKLLPWTLDCFKSAHLNWQLGYFKKRGAQHRRAAGLTNGYRVLGYLLMVAPIALAIAGLIIELHRIGLSWAWLMERLSWLEGVDRGRWQLGLGIIASSVLGFAGARSFMDQDDRNASCYALAEDVLEQLSREDLPAAESAAAAGEHARVLEFCDKVQDVLNAEHLAWGFTRPHRQPMATPKPYVL